MFSLEPTFWVETWGEWRSEPCDSWEKNILNWRKSKCKGPKPPRWECKSSCVWSREEGERSGEDESERRGFRGRNFEIKTGLGLFYERDEKMLEGCGQRCDMVDMISQEFLNYCVDHLHFYTPSQFAKYLHTQHPTTPHFPDEGTEAQRNKHNFPGIANEGVSPEQTILYRI